MRYMQGNRIILIGILLLAIVLVSGCAQVRTEAQDTLDDAILARQMNRDGIIEAYSRCNDLIDEVYDRLIGFAEDTEDPVEALHWYDQAATFVSETKRDLLTARIFRKIKDGETKVELDCFGEFELEPYGATDDSAEIEGLY